MLCPCTSVIFTDVAMIYQFARGYRMVLPHLNKVKPKMNDVWVGEEILHLLQNYLPFLPVTQLESAARGERITVNGVPVCLDYKMKQNDTVEYVFHQHEPPVLDLPIELLYIDNSLLVVNKPPSVPVHPIGRYKKNTVLEILKEEHSELFCGNGTGLYTIHRLDRPVSGVLVLARNKEIAKSLSILFKENLVKKKYVARVKGQFPVGAVRVAQPIATVSGDDRPLRFAIHPLGKMAVTVFERQAVLNEATGVESIVLCTPETGRTNQIRLHLQWLGHPVVDDAQYGGELSIPTSPPPEPHGYPRLSWCSECQQGHRDTSHVTKEALWMRTISLHSLSYHSTHSSWAWPPFTSPLPSWANFGSLAVQAYLENN